jgi:hypothetical protein
MCICIYIYISFVLLFFLPVYNTYHMRTYLHACICMWYMHVHVHVCVALSVRSGSPGGHFLCICVCFTDVVMCLESKVRYSSPSSHNAWMCVANTQTSILLIARWRSLQSRLLAPLAQKGVSWRTVQLSPMLFLCPPRFHHTTENSTTHSTSKS